MKYYKLLIAILSFTLLTANAQQEPIYSQYMFNPTIINPAYCGIYDMVSATAFHRKQFLGLDAGEPQTYSFNAHSSLPLDKMGAGISFSRDLIGINITHKFEILYSYSLDLGNDKISIGMSSGFNQFITDPNNQIVANTESDPYFISSRISSTKPGFGIGAMYLAEKFFVGISVPSMFNRTIQEGENTFKTVNRHTFVSAGYIIEPSTDIKIKPSFLIRHVAGSPVTYDINCSVLLWQNLWTGLSFRKLNTIVLMGQMQITDALKAGVSLDFAGSQGGIVKEVAGFRVGDITGVTALELMVNYNFGLFGSQAVQTTVY